jgi:iron complex transport system ATP-binding protein
MTIEVYQLTQCFGNRVLYRELDLSIEAGQCWGVLGLNGSGKSTLLHTLAGLHVPTAGEVRLEGKAVNNLSRRHIAQLIGILLQQQNDEFPVTVLETALAGCRPRLGFWGWESAEDIGRAKRWLGQLGLAGCEERLTHTLSGGERRRLAVATLMMQQPHTALLDEPDNHLDPAARKQVMEMLVEHFTCPGNNAVIALHDVNLAQRHCSHILMLGIDGEWRQGKASEMLTGEILEWLYHCPVQTVEGPTGPIFMLGY